MVKVFLQYINCGGPTFRANKEFTQLKMFTKNNFFDSWPQRYSRKAAKDLDRETDTRLSLNLSVCVTTLTVGRIGKNVCLTCHRGMLGTGSDLVHYARLSTTRDMTKEYIFVREWTAPPPPLRLPNICPPNLSPALF